MRSKWFSYCIFTLKTCRNINIAEADCTIRFCFDSGKSNQAKIATVHSTQIAILIILNIQCVQYTVLCKQRR